VEVESSQHPTDLKVAQLSVAVDIVVFTVVDRRLEVLLTLRPNEQPFPEHWALPGGFVEGGESTDQAAERALRTKAGVDGFFLEQLYTFSAPDRDPRAQVVSVAYYALVAAERLANRAGSRASRWFPVRTDDNNALIVEDESGAPIKLAFDHADILHLAVTRIRGKLNYLPIGFQLLPKQFTLTDIQRVYEAILGKPMDKRNFRTKLLKSGLIRECNEFRTGAHRPARLYEFTDRTF
jgi:8-oxo-dGTP diphosphatase